VVDARRLRNARQVIEHDSRRQSLQKLLHFDNLVAEHMNLHVPAQGVDALRQRFEHIHRRGP
jgi:hypothetical protein